MTSKDTAEFRRVAKHYSEFKGGDLMEGEAGNAHDERVYVREYRRVPVTFGWEIEQHGADMERLRHWDQEAHPTKTKYKNWHYDGSGPLEMDFGDGKYPGRQIHDFFNDVIRHGGGGWSWKGEYVGRDYGHRAGQRRHGCGSHTHFAPRPSEDLPYTRVFGEAASYTTLFNTLLDSSMCMIPLFAWGAMERTAGGGLTAESKRLQMRNEWQTWARIVGPTRYSETRMVNQLRSSGKSGHLVTLNVPYEGESRRITTCEVRMNEAPPAMSYLSGLLLNRIVRKAFERGTSVKIDDSVRSNLRYQIAEAINNASAGHRHTNSILETWGRVGPVRFSERREIPGLLTEYDNMNKLFKDILKNYTPTYPPVARVSRLFYNWERSPATIKGNVDDMWHIFAPVGRFKWASGPRAL